MAVTMDGKLYGWGKNSSWRCGVSGDEMRGAIIKEPTFIMDNVIAVKAGDTQTLVLQKDGTLWGFGSATYGALGESAQFDGKPVKLLHDENGVPKFKVVIPTIG